MNGNIYYALNPSWIEKRKNEKTGFSQLYLKEAVGFDRFGYQASWIRFDPPRLITYFANGYTLHASARERNDGEQLELGVETPLCSSRLLEPIVCDKLYTRILLACAQVGFPATLAFTYKPLVKYECPSELLVQVIELKITSGDETIEIIRNNLKTWLAETHGFTKVVVKPSGSDYQQSRGVTFHPVHDFEGIMAAVVDLLPWLDPGDAILIDEFLEPMPARTTLSAREGSLHSAMGGGPVMRRGVEDVNTLLRLQKAKPVQLGHRLRVVVQRTPGNHARVVQIICGIADLSGVIGGHNTIPRTFDGFCDVWGIAEGEPRVQVLKAVKEESRRTLQAIMEAEKKLSIEARGALRARTDCIGLDIILSLRRGVIVPVVIEVNDWDSTSQAQEMEHNMPWQFGEVVSAWTLTMMYRSARYLMHGQVLVLLADPGMLMNDTLTMLLSMHVTCIIVLPSAEAKQELQEWMAMNAITDDDSLITIFVVERMMAFPEEPAAQKIAETIKDWSEKSGRKVDGVISFLDVLARLVYLTIQVLGLPPRGGSPWVTQLGYLRGELLKSSKPPLYHSPAPYLLCPTHRLIRNAEEMQKAIEEMTPPLVLRPNRTTAGIGEKVAFQKSRAAVIGDELMKALEKVSAEGANSCYAQVFSKEVVVSEYRDGSSHYVYLVLHEGEEMGGFVMDVGPPDLPNSLTDTALALPTVLSREMESSLLRISAFILRRVNLKSGAFVFEVQLRAGLPHFHKLNSSAGGGFLGEWSQHVFDWNLTLAAAMVACGVCPPRMPPLREDIPNPHIAGVLLYTSRHTIRTKALKHLAEKGLFRVHDVSNSDYSQEMDKLEHEHASVLLYCSDISRVEVKKKLGVALQVLEVDEGNPSGNTTWFVENLCPCRKS